MNYNSQVAQSQKIEEANFARIKGQIERRRSRIAQLGAYARAGKFIKNRRCYIMPKIPTFTAQARPTAEAAGVTSNIRIPFTETVAGALRPLGKAAEDYYVKEKEIEFQVQAGELDADATVEVFNAAEQAELKNTPQEGIDYFDAQFESIRNKAKAPNKNVGDLLVLIFLKISVYVNNILKTRNNLVTTRVGQVEQKLNQK